MITKQLAYLASPYTHPDHLVVAMRVKSINKAAAILFACGHHIYSPISHTHPIFVEGSWLLDSGFEFWREYDENMMSRCDLMFVLLLEGWRESKGVTAEIDYFTRLARPIHGLDPATFNLVPMPNQIEPNAH